MVKTAVLLLQQKTKLTHVKHTGADLNMQTVAVRAKYIVTAWASEVHPRVIAHHIIHVAICPLMKGREHSLIKMN